MTAPDTALVRLAWALGLGLALGAFYGFLRPLRKKTNWPADLLFLAAAFQAWVYLSFGICRGDIRLGATVAMGLGILTWEMTVGKLLRRPIGLLWRIVGKILRLVFLPLEKFFQIILKICKKVFASQKKRGTIE